MEFTVLAKSARRCSLCFCLKGDLTEKLGQFAHLDKNPANSIEDNLAWMCLEHHSLYDSKTKQHKNYTMREVKAARAKLYRLVEEGQHLNPVAVQPDLGPDRKILHDLLEVVPSIGTIKFLRTNNFAFSFQMSQVEDIEDFYYDRNGPDHEFLDPELEAARQKFRENCNQFLTLVATHTWSLHGGDWHSVPEEWEPERFRRAVTEIHTAAAGICSTYANLVRLARKKLGV